MKHCFEGKDPDTTSMNTLNQASETAEEKKQNNEKVERETTHLTPLTALEKFQRSQDTILLLQYPMTCILIKQTNSNPKCDVMLTVGNCIFSLTLPILLQPFHVLIIPSPQLLLLLEKNQAKEKWSPRDRIQPSCYLHLLSPSNCMSYQRSISLDLIPRSSGLLCSSWTTECDHTSGGCHTLGWSLAFWKQESEKWY